MLCQCLSLYYYNFFFFFFENYSKGQSILNDDFGWKRHSNVSVVVNRTGNACAQNTTLAHSIATCAQRNHRHCKATALDVEFFQRQLDCSLTLILTHIVLFFYSIIVFIHFLSINIVFVIFARWSAPPTPCRVSAPTTHSLHPTKHLHWPSHH